MFRVTDGLQAKHGLKHCFDAPILEGNIIATAIGMGAYGLRPVPDIRLAAYILPAFDQLVCEAARLVLPSQEDEQITRNTANLIDLGSSRV